MFVYDFAESMMTGSMMLPLLSSTTTMMMIMTLMMMMMMMTMTMPTSAQLSSLYLK
jgi:hypothetical protein